ncbi:hypothetical protein ACA910_016632 [Epithemia clementina (nom. ined.)]
MQVSNSHLLRYFIGIVLFSFLCVLLAPLPPFQHLSQSYFAPDNPQVLGPCAVNLYGLPRSFKASVLPSLIKNVIRPNLLYKCDYFVHFDNLNYEKPNGRSDRIGEINPIEVYQITEAVQAEYNKQRLLPPLVMYANTTASEFQKKYKRLLHKIRTEKDSNGTSVYLPSRHKSYTFETIENVIKMWHSQESVWNLMESQTHRHYSRVAMLRSDVVYMTPIDIYELGTRKKMWDFQNVEAVVPHFARYPVNDRMIYGPYDAVKIWAAERFRRLNQHIAHVQANAPGDGLHSERFLQYTIFPAIRQTGITIEFKQGMCFYRVRADHSVRFSDCGKIHVTKHNHKVVENMVGRSCVQNWTFAASRNLVQLECPFAAKTPASDETDLNWHSGCNPNMPKKIPLPPKRRRRSTLWPKRNLPPPTHPPCMDEHISLVIQRETSNLTSEKKT